MLRLGDLAKGNMQQCLDELNQMDLPDSFKLKQIRSLLRYMRDVNSLVEHIKTDSGFDGDTTSYLDILCAKEDSELLRRVSHTKVLRQVSGTYHSRTAVHAERGEKLFYEYRHMSKVPSVCHPSTSRPNNVPGHGHYVNSSNTKTTIE